MTEPRTIIVTLDPSTAHALDTLAAHAGMTVGTFVGDQLQHAFSHSVLSLSRREAGRSKRRASRRRRRAIALANRTRCTAKAAGTPQTEPETPSNV